MAKTLLRCLVVGSVLLTTVSGRASEGPLKERARQAYLSSESDPYEAATAYVEILREDEKVHEFDAKMRQGIRKLLVMLLTHAYEYDKKWTDSEYAARILGLFNLVEPYAPTVGEMTQHDYDGRFDNYILGLVYVAVAYRASGETGKSRNVLAKADRFAKLVQDKDYSKVYRESRKVVDTVRSLSDSPNPGGVGSYVTNRSGLQNWIGQVVSVSGQRVQVRLTYVRGDGPTSERRGQTIAFPQDEVAPLTSVSVDAMLKGY